MTTKGVAEILGNPNYLAISYGGYRTNSRDEQPAVEELKEDLKILAAMGVKFIRTYNVHLDHASNCLAAIRELKNEDENFEMYVMLGAWIDCKNAWTDLPPIHDEESERNGIEIVKAVALTNEYPDIVKVIAVGNEAMVKWATSYYVQPEVILKWVSHLQDLKRIGELPQDVWITSSDNFASWGGGEDSYHVEALNQLLEAVDYISLHTYPMHDTHYNASFWGILEDESSLSKQAKIDQAMRRAVSYAQSQFQAVQNYMLTQGIKKPIHIGETGWASYSKGLYGNNGSFACDEYKEGVYYELMRKWTNEESIACFYFEAFDEPWKDAANPMGSENHFGLFTNDGKAKFALWNLVDEGTFSGLTRDGNAIEKSHDGKLEILMNQVQLPPIKSSLNPQYQTP